MATPCVLLFLNTGLITPPYGGLEPPWRAAYMRRLSVHFPRGLRYVGVAHTEVCCRHSYGALLLFHSKAQWGRI